MTTLVIQSHRNPLPYNWLEKCLASVRAWSEVRNYEYHFLGDELFDGITGLLNRKIEYPPVVLSDLARLLECRKALNNGFDRVVWLDADFLIFDQGKFNLPDESYALGREVWVQQDQNSKLKAYKKVHNAFLMFTKGNCFLEYYIESAMRLLQHNHGKVPSQFIGPKFLTALHNITLMPVLESAGMISPLVIRDVVRGGGQALELFKAQSRQSIFGANLCISSCDRNEITSDEMLQAIEILISGNSILSK